MATNNLQSDRFGDSRDHMCETAAATGDVAPDERDAAARRPARCMRKRAAIAACALAFAGALAFGAFAFMSPGAPAPSSALDVSASFAEVTEPQVRGVSEGAASDDAVRAFEGVLRTGDANAQSLSDVPASDYAGFICKLSDGEGAVAARARLDAACDAGGVSKLAEGTYACDSLDALSGIVSADELAYVEPDYTMHLIGDADGGAADAGAENAAGDGAPREGAAANAAAATAAADDSAPASAAAQALAAPLGGTATNPAPDWPVTDPYPNADGAPGWNLDMMNVGAAWEQGLDGDAYSYAGKPVREGAVKVAVIDTGLYGTGHGQPEHEDIDYAHVADAVSFVDTDEGAYDQRGHGTFVSGLIAARVNNGVGVAGAAPGVTIVPCKVFGTGDAQTADVISGIYYAVDTARVDVINMSLGGSYNSTALEEACDYAVSKGVIVVASAGNDGTSTPNYPAACDSVVGVASVDKNKQRSTWSQYGKSVFVTAPGENVTSTYIEGASSYKTGSGTSFSGPEVAALAAVCKAVYPDMTQDVFKELLIDTSVDLGAAGYDDFYGWGLVDFGAMGNRVLESQVLPWYNVTVSATDVEGRAVSDIAVEVRAAEDVTWEADAQNGVFEAGSIAAGELIEPNPDGTYRLHRGTYSYTVSAEGFYKYSGTFRTYAENQSVECVLEPAYRATLSVVDSLGQGVPAATLAVTSPSGRVEEPAEVSGGAWAFDLAAGTYSYAASAEGFKAVTGTFSVPRSDRDLRLSLRTPGELSRVSFTAVEADSSGAVDGCSLSVRNASGMSIDAAEDGTFLLAKGETYTVVASKLGYADCKQAIVVGDASAEGFELRLEKAECAVTFRVVDENGRLASGAAVEVVNEQGTPFSPADGNALRFNLRSGTYRYTVSAPGFESVSARLDLSVESRTVSVVLAGIEQSVTFDVRGGADGAAVEGASIKVSTNYSNAALPQQPDGTWLLVPGEYRYTAYAEGYKAAYGSFAVAGPCTVSVNLAKAAQTAEGFAGGAGTAEDPYLIANEAQLRYLADQTQIVRKAGADAPSNRVDVVGEGTYYQLVADIALAEEWEPIGNYEKQDNYAKFAGHFDGAGHTVSGVQVNHADWDNQGFFGYVQGAVIENLTVEGSILGANNVGGIVGKAEYNADTGLGDWATGANAVSNCANRAAVAGECFVGGIVGSTTSGGLGYNPVVGSGEYGMVVSQCANHGSVSATRPAKLTGHAAGGIVGWAQLARVEFSYNDGAIEADYQAGGVVGNASSASSLSNCYNAAPVRYNAASSVNAEANGGVVGNMNNAAATALYGVVHGESDVVRAIGKSASSPIAECAMMDRADMLTDDFVSNLNTDRADDALKTVFVRGGDFPLLRWEPRARGVLVQAPQITVQPQGAMGDAAYKVGADAAPLSAQVAAVGDGGTVSWRWFSCDDERGLNAAAVAGASGTGLAASFTPPTSRVGVTYYFVEFANTRAEAGEHATATARSNAVGVAVRSVTDAAVPQIVGLNPTATEQMRTKVSAKQTTDLELSVRATAPDGGKLSYQWYSSSSASGAGTPIEGATAAAYLADTTQLGTVFYCVEVTNTLEEGNAASARSEWVEATVAEYTIGTYGELASFRTAVNEGTSFAGVTVTLTADIAIPAGVSWEPIGTMEHPFTGVFMGGRGTAYSNDIAVHSVTGVNVDGDRCGNDAVGLFGACAYPAEIYDVVVSGSVSGAANTKAGLLVGACLTNTQGSPCVIVNCATTAGSSVEGKYAVGGLVGYGNAQMIECANHADVTARAFEPTSADRGLNSAYQRWTMAVGGVAGFAGSGTMMGCYNTGTVAVEAAQGGLWSAVSAGGVTGYVHAYSGIGSCFNAGDLVVGTKVPDTAPGVRYAGAVAGYVQKDNFANLHYLDGSYECGNIDSYGYEGSENHTLAFMKSDYFVGLMNDGTFACDFAKSANGVPHLKYESDDTVAGGLVDAAEPYITDITMEGVSNLTNTFAVSFFAGEHAKPFVVHIVGVDGGSLTYAWQRRATGAGDDAWQDVAGAEGAVESGTASFAPPTDSEGTTEYRCVVTNTLAEATGVKSMSNETPAIAVTVKSAEGLFGLADPDMPNSESNPWVIATAEQLATFASVVNGSERVVGVDDATFKDQYVALDADIDLSNRNWIPAGTESNPFSGVFDGRGHTVSNLTITRSAQDPADASAMCALIGNATYAYVKNLAVTGTVSVDNANGWNTAGVVAYSYGTYIENVVNAVDVTGFDSVGGVVGRALSTRIEDCENVGSVRIGSAALADSGYSGNYAGGIAGYVANTGHADGAGVFTSFNQGAVAGKSSTGEHLFGSLMGVRGVDTAVEGCFYVEGTTTCLNDSSKSQGGIGSKLSHAEDDAAGVCESIEDANSPQTAWQLATSCGAKENSARWGTFAASAYGDAFPRVHLVLGDAARALYRADTAQAAASITISQMGSAAASEYFLAGENVSVAWESKPGFTVRHVFLVPAAGGEPLPLANGGSFTMPASDVSFAVEADQDASFAYAVAAEALIDGAPAAADQASATVSASEAKAGEVVEAAISVGAGYQVKSVACIGSSGASVALVRSDGAHYSFTMPAESVTFRLVVEPLGAAADRRAPSLDVTREAVHVNADARLRTGTLLYRSIAFSGSCFKTTNGTGERFATLSELESSISVIGLYEQEYSETAGEAHRYTGYVLSDLIEALGAEGMVASTPVAIEGADGTVFTCTWGDLTSLSCSTYDADGFALARGVPALLAFGVDGAPNADGASFVCGQASPTIPGTVLADVSRIAVGDDVNYSLHVWSVYQDLDRIATEAGTSDVHIRVYGADGEMRSEKVYSVADIERMANADKAGVQRGVYTTAIYENTDAVGDYSGPFSDYYEGYDLFSVLRDAGVPADADATSSVQFYQTSQTGLEGSWKTVNVSLGYLAGNGAAGAGDYSGNFVAYGQGVEGSGTEVGGPVSADRKIVGVHPMIVYGKNGYPLVYSSGTVGMIQSAYNYRGPLMAFLPQNEAEGGGYVGDKTATSCFLGLIEVRLADGGAAPDPGPSPDPGPDPDPDPGSGGGSGSGGSGGGVQPAPGSEKQPGAVTTPVLPDIDGASAATLADVALPSGWSWAAPSTALKAGSHAYQAIYRIPASDLERFDYSQVPGFDARTGTVSRMLTVVVAQSDGSSEDVAVKIGRGVDVPRVDGGDEALRSLKAMPQFAGAKKASLSLVVGKEGSDSSLSHALRDAAAGAVFRSFFYLNVYLNADGRMVDVGNVNDGLLAIDCGTFKGAASAPRVIRVVDGTVGEITGKANAAGEFLSYDVKTGKLVAHVKKAGTFGVAFGGSGLK